MNPTELVERIGAFLNTGIAGTPFTPLKLIIVLTLIALLIWVTGKGALLGIQNGYKAPLHHPIDAEHVAWTGLDTSWQTSADNCMGWTSGNGLHKGRVGNAGLVDEFLDFGTANCGDLLGIPFICVETL